ncbi:hypothetical protein ABIE26_003980 [Pedobacter africanus]|uniref:Uncharacterized protein n=1 Tax=Pedobacter africanus TaxID=151894 RepID=A0ACC6L1S3_9SPHI|nr:hypothetical protein [Pedobacter africanus]
MPFYALMPSPVFIELEEQNTGLKKAVKQKTQVVVFTFFLKDNL